MSESKSNSWSLDQIDWAKIWTSFKMTVVTALLTAACIAVARWFDQLPALMDWGAWTPIVAVFFPFAANIIRKAGTDNTKLKLTSK